MRILTDAVLIKKYEIAKNIFDFTLKIEKEIEFIPGQFIHVKTDSVFLRRPFALVDIYKNNLRFIFRKIGKGTSSLADKKIGEKINFLGPLGNGFKAMEEKTLTIGGGTGIFPILALTKILKDNTTILGFRNKEDVILEKEFLKFSQNLIVTTNDGSYGESRTPLDHLSKINLEIYKKIYVCGPIILIKLISEICAKSKIECEASFETIMACGIGACSGCALLTTDGKYKKVCYDGPVFDTKKISFN